MKARYGFHRDYALNLRATVTRTSNHNCRASQLHKKSKCSHLQDNNTRKVIRRQADPLTTNFKRRWCHPRNPTRRFGLCSVVAAWPLSSDWGLAGRFTWLAAVCPSRTWKKRSKTVKRRQKARPRTYRIQTARHAKETWTRPRAPRVAESAAPTAPLACRRAHSTRRPAVNVESGGEW